MKHLPITMFALLTVAAGSAGAASVVVDWLVTQPGGSATAFNLLDDANAATSSGSMAIANGSAYPGLPTSRAFAAGNWTTLPDVADTLSGDAGISATEFRVAPAAGQANYAINLRVPSNQPFIIALGGMLKNSTSATQFVEIAALSDSGAVPVALRSYNAWSNGLTILNQGVTWNPLTQVLSTTAGADGDSVFAFFEVAPLAGTNARLSFSVPASYAAGTGDSIFIGVGAVIPEPATAGLLLLGAGSLAGRRRRNRAY